MESNGVRQSSEIVPVSISEQEFLFPHATELISTDSE